MHKYTVIWGDIGDECCTRLDHVEVAEPTFAAIMDAAFRVVFDEWEAGQQPMTWAELRHETPYDGHAIIAGHVTDAPGLGFE